MLIKTAEKIKNTANQALERLTEIYLLDSLELPSLEKLPETLMEWYQLSNPDAEKVIAYLNNEHTADMRDMGYLIRRQNKWFPNDFSCISGKDTPSIADALGNAKKYTGCIIRYIIISVEQDRWVTLKKPQKDPEINKICNDLVKEGIFQESSSEYRISDQAMEKIDKYLGLTK